jgi:hypothetical protein
MAHRASTKIMRGSFHHPESSIIINYIPTDLSTECVLPHRDHQMLVAWNNLLNFRKNWTIARGIPRSKGNSDYT